MVRFNDKHKKSVAEYLNTPSTQTANYDVCTNAARKSLEHGSIINAISNLEDARDAHKGIITTTKDDLLIRDARHCHKQHVPEGVEAAQIRVLVNFEAAKDIIQGSKKIKSKDNITATLDKMALEFFDRSSSNHKGQSADHLFKFSKKEILRIGDFLTKCGINNADKKLEQASHFQNFKQEKNYNPVTISTISGQNIVEASVSYRELTPEQKDLYDEISNSKAVSKTQRKLMKKYREEVFSSDYVIPASLITCLPGIKNAFEESTFVVKQPQQEENIQTTDFELIDSRKRAAALPSLLKDKELTKKTAQANLKQAQGLMTDGKSELNWNSLNTDVKFLSSLGILKRPKIEADIISNSKDAAKNNGASVSVTPFNAFRRIGNHDLKAVDKYLQELGKSIPSDSAWQKKIKTSIKRPKLHKKAKNFFKDTPSFDTAIEGLDDETQEIFSLARSIRKDMKKHSSFFSKGLDKENLNLQISTKFGHLTHLVNEALEKNDSGLKQCCKEEKVPRQEMVVSCKSGKDRTGFNCFYRMAKKVASKIGINFGEACADLHYSNHIETIPGSLRVGGGTAGCYQLQKPVLAALPKSEAGHLKDIIGPFSHGNKKPERSVFHKRKTDFTIEKADQKTPAIAEPSEALEAETIKKGIGIRPIQAARLAPQAPSRTH